MLIVITKTAKSFTVCKSFTDLKNLVCSVWDSDSKHELNTGKNESKEGLWKRRVFLELAPDDENKMKHERHLKIKTKKSQLSPDMLSDTHIILNYRMTPRLIPCSKKHAFMDIRRLKKKRVSQTPMKTLFDEILITLLAHFFLWNSTKSLTYSVDCHKLNLDEHTLSWDHKGFRHRIFFREVRKKTYLRFWNTKTYPRWINIDTNSEKPQWETERFSSAQKNHTTSLESQRCIFDEHTNFWSNAKHCWKTTLQKFSKTFDENFCTYFDKT